MTPSQPPGQIEPMPVGHTDDGHGTGQPSQRIPHLSGLVLLVGGARSGKSSLAADLASRWAGPVTVIATAEPGDEEMAARIAVHRQERPAHWDTIEEPFHLTAALGRVDSGRCVVVDCLTLWVANLLAANHSIDQVGDLATSAADVAAAREAPTVGVTNEVGSGIVPATALGRRYRDCLGTVNQIWAEAANRVFLVVAGRMLELHRPEAQYEAAP